MIHHGHCESENDKQLPEISIGLALFYKLNPIPIMSSINFLLVNNGLMARQHKLLSTYVTNF
uniref:Uncharacterized protein n=1 Tax=Rhizophora mucronata TaxID=61149 RepID=A0A2P2NAG8_RHIMU